MRFLLRVVLIGVAVYSIATASPAQQAAMYEGVRAFGLSVRDACLRTSPCNHLAQRAMTALASARLALARPEERREQPLLER
jgi:hypothetical protein